MSTAGIDSAERIGRHEPAAKDNGFAATSNPAPEFGEVGRGRQLEEEEKKRMKERDLVDPELFSCLLRQLPTDWDPNYVCLRRLLLHRKASSGILRRREWRCNGKGYVAAYRNYIQRPRGIGRPCKHRVIPSTPWDTGGSEIGRRQENEWMNRLISEL